MVEKNREIILTWQGIHVWRSTVHVYVEQNVQNTSKGDLYNDISAWEGKTKYKNKICRMQENMALMLHVDCQLAVVKVHNSQLISTAKKHKWMMACTLHSLSSGWVYCNSDKACTRSEVWPKCAETQTIWAVWSECKVNARMSPMKLQTHHGRWGKTTSSCTQRSGGSEICLWVSWTGCQHRLTLGISKTEIWRASSVGDIQCFKRLSGSRVYLQKASECIYINISYI